MRTEVSVDDLLANVQLERAKRVAYARVREDFNEENVLNLLRILATGRDARGMKRVLKRWKERYGVFPESFYEVLGLYYMLTLQTDHIFPILPKIPEHVAFWILTTLGYTEKAKEYDLTLPARAAAIRLLEGYDYEPPEDISPIEKLFFVFFNSRRYLVGGEIRRALVYVDEALSMSLKQGAMGIALNAMTLRGAFRMNPADIEVARYVSQSLGDRMGYTVASIYLGLVEGKVPDLEIPKTFPMLRVMYDYLKYVVRNEGVFRPVEGLRSLYNMWWYLHKIRRDKVYITFAGKLRVMRGSEMLRIPQKQVLCVVFAKIGGKELLQRYAHLLFPDSKDPRRRAMENLSRASELRFAPSDMYLTLRFGNFLRDEDGAWAEVLREEATKRAKV